MICICGIIFFFSQRMKKQIRENGVISRITDETGLRYDARCRTADGLLSFACFEGTIVDMEAGLPSSKLTIPARKSAHTIIT